MKHFLILCAALFAMFAATGCRDGGPAERYSLEINGVVTQDGEPFYSDFSVIVENASYRAFRDGSSIDIFTPQGAQILRALDAYVEDFVIKYAGKNAPYDFTVDGYLQDKNGVVYRVKRQYSYRAERIQMITYNDITGVQNSKARQYANNENIDNCTAFDYDRKILSRS